MTPAATTRLDGLRWAEFGSGAPVTLVVPGLAATEGEARIPASGLPGTRIVLTLPGHGSAPDAPEGYWRYDRVAADVEVVADTVGAEQAVGVSLGAGALTRLVAARPDRFRRLALLLPAAVDGPRSVPAVWAMERLADAVEDGDDVRLRELVAAELPPGAQVGDYVERRVAALRRVGPALRALPEQNPLDAAAALAAVRVPVLVIGATADPLHAESAARATAAAFPAAHLELFDSAAPLVTHRREIRRLLTDFLATP